METPCFFILAYYDASGIRKFITRPDSIAWGSWDKPVLNGQSATRIMMKFALLNWCFGTPLFMREKGQSPLNNDYEKYQP